MSSQCRSIVVQGEPAKDLEVQGQCVPNFLHAEDRCANHLNYRGDFLFQRSDQLQLFLRKALECGRHAFCARPLCNRAGRLYGLLALGWQQGAVM